MKKIMIIGIIAVCISFTANNVFATPTLGVAVAGGVYAYNDPGALTDEYINYFATGGIVPSAGGLHGYIIPPSGGYLTVFTSYDPSLTDIYLFTNTGSGHYPITFGTQTLASMGDTGQIDGYVPYPPYYYGTPNPLPKDLTEWTTAVFETSKTFYLYEAQLTYTGALSDQPLNYYFFAVGDINGTPGIQFSSGMKDDFSPKTTSAGGHTPEPATMLLFGIGAAGFGIVRRRNHK
jgi:hypothetical protein